MGHLRKEDIRKIVDHLISSDVGVTSVSDLKDMTLQFLPPSVPPLKRNQLLASLKAAGNQAAGPQATGTAIHSISYSLNTDFPISLLIVFTRICH